MKNLDKYNGDAKELSRVVKIINQRVRELKRNGYEVLGVSQNAEVYNNNEKYEKLLQKLQEITQPDYAFKLHDETIKIMENNLKSINKNKKWLISRLEKQGKKEINNILLATCDTNEKLTIYEKNIKGKNSGCLE